MRDVVIVGGGIAGLAAGWRLRHWDTMLLESGHRVGGRIRSERRGQYWLNWGGHVYAGGNSSTAWLLGDTGIDSVGVPGSLAGLAMNGKLLLNGRVETYPFRIPMSWSSRLSLMKAGAKVRLAVARYARIVELRAGEDEAARQQRVYNFMDDRSFSDFVGDLSSDSEALFKPTVTRSAADMHEISAGAGVGYFSLVWNMGAGLSRSILGGPSTLTEGIAAALSDRVQLDATVDEVVHKRNSALVRYRQHGVEHEVEARCVVLATPAPVSHRVGVDLDSDVREALSKIVYGPYVSAAFLTNETERQVWDGAYAIATPKRSFNVILNMSNIARGFEAERRPGSSIMTFSSASLARGLLELDDDEIRKIYIDELDQVLPNFAQHVVEAEIQRWRTGAPYCFPRRGKLQPALTRKGGRVLLAGDYLGTRYTETAIHTGLSAAQEAQSLLAEDRHGVRKLIPVDRRVTHGPPEPHGSTTSTTRQSPLPTLGGNDMTARLSGVLTALVTPFTSSGQVDEKNLRRLVDRNILGGVDGVVACGSTGEFAAMSAAERRFVVETVIDQAAGRVPVVAQTGAVSTAEAVELSRHGEEAGASVLMVVTPYYEPLTLDETLRYLRTVAGAVDIPIMLYNLPVATGVNLAPATVGKLAREVENVQYIKDTSADMAQASQLIHNYGDVVSTFVGWDSLLLAALSEGAAGVMAGTANVMAAELVSIHRALAEGDLNRARAEWEQIYPLMDAIMNAPFVPAVKAALNALGFPAGSPREPFLDLDHATAATISALAAALPQPAPAL